MISEDIKITPALAYASGTADRNGATLDMKGFDGVLMVVQLATVAAGAVTSIKAQQGAASNLSDAADLAGTGVAIAADDDDEVKYIDLWQPRERYVRVVVDKDGSNACAESAVYIQYRARELPTTHAATVTGEAHLAPAEGTA
jgi:hypothetical protein